MTVPINPIQLQGNWAIGTALDLHTVSSELLADGTFNTQRTQTGEILYQLKYCDNRERISDLVEAACKFIRESPKYQAIEAIIPAPPSDLTRHFQPVPEIAGRIGEQLGIPVLLDYIVKNKETIPLKTIDDTESRRNQLKDAFMVRDFCMAGKCVLLFDDLFRSGETLSAITDVMKRQGKVAQVCVLTITKTRTKR